MIEQSTVDGVTAVFTQRPGPTVMGLSFRVGMADETLATRGITHMVEHLALHRAGLSDYHANGSTGGSVTTFHVGGKTERAVEFIELACRSLNDLPLDRLEMERAVIRTEGASRVASDMGLWRYGAQGYGLASYPEWGIPNLTGEQLAAWTAEWFTADNAVLWVSGEGMPELSLGLPRGERKAPPAEVIALPELPACYSSGRGQVAFDSTVTRSSAATLTAALMERELYQSLRVESALSYAVNVRYEPFGADLAGISGFADALDDNEAALVGATIDALAAIGAQRYDPAVIEGLKVTASEYFDQPHLDAARLPGVAQDVLVGAPVRPFEELSAELHAVTPEHVQAVIGQVVETMLLRAPFGTDADWGGFAAAPLMSTTSVTGTSYPLRDGSGQQLIIGSDGVTVSGEDGQVTVLYAEVAGVLAWPDGAIRLVGLDALAVSIEPTIANIPAETLEWLYNQMPSKLYAVMPAREPEDIPQPVAEVEAGGKGRLPWRRRKQG